MKRRHFMTTLAAVTAIMTPTTLRARGFGHRLSEEFLKAVRTGNLAEVRAMLQRDASLVYARDQLGRSAFVLAHLHNHPQVANHLAEQGFLMDVVEATLARNWERLEEIGAVSPGVFNAHHPIGGNAIYAAAMVGLGRDMWRLLQYGADPNASFGGETFSASRAAVDFAEPIMALETTATLLGNGGDPNTHQRGDSSVLHGAAASGNVNLIRLALRKGGDPTARDEAGRTPKDVASALGHQAAVQLLDNHRSVPRDHRTSRFAFRADGSRYTPPSLDGFDLKLQNRLVGASHFNLELTTQITDQYPALATSVSYADEAAVEAAAHTGRREVARLLLDRGAPYSLPTATTMGDLTWAKRLLDEDTLRVHERGAHDFALMWYPAIGGGSVELAQLFLDHGADIEQEHLGTTGLHFAVRGGFEDLTRLLLERGANPDGVGRKFVTAGETPLDLASKLDSARVTELLVAGGATRRVMSTR